MNISESFVEEPESIHSETKALPQASRASATGLITFEYICQEYERALKACCEKIPLKQWAHKPVGVKLTRHKTKYGMANSRGEVFISEAFLNTQANTKLKNTMRHELAHLAAGLWHGHSRVFKSVEILFGARAAVAKQEVDEVHNNISFKWELIAHLSDGRSLSLGGRHRKSKSFTHYPDNKRLMTVDGVPVKYFSFIEYTV